MTIKIFNSKIELGRAAADHGAEMIKKVLEKKKTARIILATGASQFEMLAALVETRGIDWKRIEMFHLDEYVGLPETHPASFRRYLKERFADRVHPGKAHFIGGDAKDPAAEADRVGREIAKAQIDVAFVGIGENGHLAFNDPPADFETEKPYLVVALDEACRRQQLGEGWFKTLEDVPGKAISMSIRQIMKSDVIIACVPDKRKARAVSDCLAEKAPVTNLHPSSILKRHEKTFVFLDTDSASLLGKA